MTETHCQTSQWTMIRTVAQVATRCKALLLTLAVLPIFATGCGSMRETFPPRSATEQLLMSTAVDLAVATLETKELHGKCIFIDPTNLKGYDPEYVLVALRKRLLQLDAKIAPDKMSADLMMEVSTGALSVDHRSNMIGIPGIPLPLPFTGTPYQTPELPLFKVVKHTGIAKIILTCVNAADGSRAVELPVLRGSARMWERWYLLLGPFRSTSLHEEFQKH